MTGATPAAHGPRTARQILILAVAAFSLVTLATWPYALSFSDEVGYLGQAQLLWSGRIAPNADSPGSFYPGPEGERLSKYPLFVPLVLSPFAAAAPRSVFVLGFASLLVLVALGARALRAWRAEPAFALLVLIHPTFVLTARTAMPDTWLAAASVAAWWFGEQNRRWLAASLLALVVLIKPTGVTIAGALVLGQAIRARTRGADIATIVRQVGPAAVGIAVGAALVALLNWLQWGRPYYAYSAINTAPGVPAFALANLRTSGVTHLLSLLLVPPGLLLGVWGLWRRRLFGPLLAIAVLLALMSTYFFVDFGRSRAETLVMAQRLTMPASAFLLLGVGGLLSDWFRSLPRHGPLLRRAVVFGLAGLAPVLSMAIGWQHRAWQRPMHEALLDAERLAAEQGEPRLGTTSSAVKAAMMHRGPVSIASRSGPSLPVVLCSQLGASYRETVPTSCDLPGYVTRDAYGPFRVLVAR